MKQKALVTFTDTKRGISAAVRGQFGRYGHTLLKKSRDVYIKVNAVDLRRYCYTDPEVLRQVILHFKDWGARHIYVMDNCTQGNFTRLVFRATGMDRICSDTGSQVTLSIKNQFGFVHQASRIADHNFKLHQKFADIYRLLRPDFVIIDGTIATDHGHYLATKYAPQCVRHADCPLAVDTVAASFMGFTLKQVKHLDLAARTGIGQGDIGKITIANRELYNDRKMHLTHELLERFPDDLNIIRGKERCCEEGCRRNTETVAEVFHADHGGKGGFTIIMGKGVDAAAVAAVRGRVHLAGSCAIQEHGAVLLRRLGKKNVTMSSGCNNLAETIRGLCRQMGVSTLSLADVNPVTALLSLMKARINGTRAIIPPLFNP